MIQHLSRTEIDPERWDAVVAAASEPRVYGMSWWLDAVSPNWSALVLNDYEAVMPLTAKRKLGIDYLAQPHFTQQLGVFAAANVQVQDYLKAIPTQYKLIEINLRAGNALKHQHDACTEMANYVLPFTPDYEPGAAYSSNLRRNLKRAETAGLNISQNDTGIADLIDLFRSDRKELSRQLGTDYFEVLGQCFSAIQQHAQPVILEARAGNDLLASALFVIFKRYAVFLFSGNSVVGREKAALPAIINWFIAHYHSRLDVLDFEGSNDAGLARFYSGFGSRKTIYLHYRENRLPKALKWLKQ